MFSEHLHALKLSDNRYGVNFEFTVLAFNNPEFFLHFRFE